MSCEGCKIFAFDQRSHMQNECNPFGCLTTFGFKISELEAETIEAETIEAEEEKAERKEIPGIFIPDKFISLDDLFKAMQTEQSEAAALHIGPPIPFADRMRSCGCAGRVGENGPMSRCGRYGNKNYYEHVNDK